MARIAAFDRTWSRFRPDSLVSTIASRPGGAWEFPAEAPPLFELYRRLYEATAGALSPLVGNALDVLGYDRAYSLRPSGDPRAAPTWDETIAWDGRYLTTINPVSIDVGAAGKGYLVDLVAELLTTAGHTEFTVDASGDIRHLGAEPITVALEHPVDTSKAIGVVRLGDGAICSSASNRRAWGEGLHHLIDATTGMPVRGILATWVLAATALEADGLATALFVTEPERLSEHFDFDWVRMHASGRVEFSPALDGELFS